MQLHDLYVWLVPDGIDFGPVYRDAAPNLDKAQLGARLIADEEDLLRLVEVGNVPFGVDAAPEIACSRTVAGSPADEAEAKLVNTNADGSDVEGWWKEYGSSKKRDVFLEDSLP